MRELGASRILSLQKRHQLRSARVRRHAVFDHISPLAEHSADILVPPRLQTPAQCGLFRSHLLVCVFYYCKDLLQSCSRGGGGEWRTCAMRDDEPRPAWISLPITHARPGSTPGTSRASASASRSSVAMPRQSAAACSSFNHVTRSLSPWFLSFGNRTQNSRVACARPNHQADRGSDPNHRGIWSPPRAFGDLRCKTSLHGSRCT